jgi:hypothetical protein
VIVLERITKSFDKLINIDYRGIEGNRYERTNPATKDAIREREVERRVRQGLREGPPEPTPTEEKAPQKGVDLGPSAKIANWIQENLKIGNKVDWKQLFKRADTAFRGIIYIPKALDFEPERVVLVKTKEEQE